jgi:hypothetical protein
VAGGLQSGALLFVRPGKAAGWGGDEMAGVLLWATGQELLGCQLGTKRQGWKKAGRTAGQRERCTRQGAGALR